MPTSIFLNDDDDDEDKSNKKATKKQLLMGFTDTSAPGHFGPKTLRHLYLVPKCPGPGAEVSRDTSAPVPKCLKTLREGAAGESDSDVSMQTHVSRTVSSCFATLYDSCAAFVGRRHKRYWSSRWCCRAWTMATRRSPVYQATSSTDYSL